MEVGTTTSVTKNATASCQPSVRILSPRSHRFRTALGLTLISFADCGLRRMPPPYLKVPGHVRQAHGTQFCLDIRVPIGEIWHVGRVLDHHIGITNVGQDTLLV